MIRQRVAKILVLVAIVLPTSVSCGEPLLSPQLWGTFANEIRPQGANFIGKDRLIIVYPCKESCDNSIILHNISSIQSTAEKMKNRESISTNEVYVDFQGALTPAVTSKNKIISPRVPSDDYNASLFSFGENESNPTLEKNLAINVIGKKVISFKSFNEIEGTSNILAFRKFSECAYLFQDSDLEESKEINSTKSVCPQTNAKDEVKTQGFEVDKISGFVAFKIDNISTMKTTSIALGNDYSKKIPIVSEIFGVVDAVVVVGDTVIIRHRSPADGVSPPGKVDSAARDWGDISDAPTSYTLVDRNGVSTTVQGHGPRNPYLVSILKYCLAPILDKHAVFESTLTFVEKNLNDNGVIRDEEFLSSSGDGQLVAFRSGKTIRIYKYNPEFCGKVAK